MRPHYALLGLVLASLPLAADRCLGTDQALAPGSLATGNLFGSAVSADGDVAAAGAPLQTNGNLGAGAVYVYRKDSGGMWIQEQRLVAADPDADDLFGSSVVVLGDTILVGAYLDDEGASNGGAVYVFDHDGTSWSQTQKLLPSDPEANAFFGISVDADGDTLVVGANRDDGPGGADQGAAYVFERVGSTWAETQKLQAADGTTFDQFAREVAISGDTLVAGAHLDAGVGNSSGSVYLFTRSGGAWSQDVKLTASDATAGDRFGHAVDLEGTLLIVGAYEDDFPTPGTGSVYVFEHGGGGWSEVQELRASDAAALDDFGREVALAGTLLVVGADGNDEIAVDAGAAYVFEWNGATFAEVGKIVDDAGESLDYLGFDVAISGTSVLVGAISGDDGQLDAGTVHSWRVGQTFDLLGTGSAGSLGLVPILASPDCFAENLPATVRITNAMGGAPGLIVVGNTQIAFPFLGGTLYTVPISTTPVVLGGLPGVPGTGVFNLFVQLQPTLPSGVTFTMQAGVFDSGAASGVALTNARLLAFP